MKIFSGLLFVLLTSVATRAQRSPTSIQAKLSGNESKSEISDPVLVGAGDIASCDDLSGAVATAKLLDKIPGTVFAAGDLAYPDGSDEQFANCYGPTWGRHKNRTRPAQGNHEFRSDGASGYARYFGIPAPEARKGYYSY